MNKLLLISLAGAVFLPLCLPMPILYRVHMLVFGVS